VEAEDVMQDIIRQGTELMMVILKKEKELGKEDPGGSYNIDDNGRQPYCR